MKEIPDYRNPELPVRRRIDDLISRMSPGEKIAQLVHSSVGVPRLGVPDYQWWNECLHGVARAGRATVFPQAIGLAATFDRDCIRRVADAISDEARAKFHGALRTRQGRRLTGLTFWSPNINIFRDPRWGRGQETWGEDPFLTAETGSAFVKGLQGDHPVYLKTAACAKHFAVHSGPESKRHVFDARVSPKDLHETYLPAFKRLVDDGVEAVMGAYNRTNGEVCCGSPSLLRRILRKQWGFSGHVVSDCWAIRDFWESHKVVDSPGAAAALALANTCDLNCGDTYPALRDAVEQGLVSEKLVDESLGRLLATRFKLGLFDPDDRVPFASIPFTVVNCRRHRDLAREAARKSIVLLKNAGNLLPLARTTASMYVTGHNAASVDVLLGNYHGVSGRLVTVLEGLCARAPGTMRIEYRHGNLYSGDGPEKGNWAVGTARLYDVVIAVIGLSPLVENEEGDAVASTSGGDRERIELPAGQVAFVKALAETGKPLIVVLAGGSPMAIPEIHECADAVLYLWYPGEQGGHALADIVFGKASPSGRLPVTVPAATTDLPPFEDYSMRGRTYRYMTREPLYPFGFGLGYTTFRYESIELSPDTVTGDRSVSADVTLVNSGPVEAEEVVQLYIRHHAPAPETPLRSLVGFERIALEPGRRGTVRFSIAPEQLRRVDNQGALVPAPGEIEVIAAGACPTPRSRALGGAKPVTARLRVRGE